MKLHQLIFQLAPFIAALGFSQVRADHLRLANGDVISGQLVSQVDGVIRFSSPILGVLELKESEASVVAKNDKEQSAPKEKRVAKSRPQSDGGDEDVDINGTSTPGGKWRSKVSFGFNWQDGKKQQRDINLRFEADRKSGPNQYRFQTRYRFTDTNGTMNADRRDAGVRWRREFDERWFSQTNTTYFDDNVREIDLNIDQNVGVGYKLIKSDRAKASVGAGVTVQYREAAGIKDGIAKFGEFFQDLVFRLNDRVEFAQEAAALFSPDDRPLGTLSSGPMVVVPKDVANYRVTFQSVLRGRVTESVTVNLRYEYEFDNAVINRDARADQRVSTSLGYVF